MADGDVHGNNAGRVYKTRRRLGVLTRIASHAGSASWTLHSLSLLIAITVLSFFSHHDVLFQGSVLDCCLLCCEECPLLFGYKFVVQRCCLLGYVLRTGVMRVLTAVGQNSGSSGQMPLAHYCESKPPEGSTIQDVH